MLRLPKSELRGAAKGRTVESAPFGCSPRLSLAQAENGPEDEQSHIPRFMTLRLLIPLSYPWNESCRRVLLLDWDNLAAPPGQFSSVRLRR